MAITPFFDDEDPRHVCQKWGKLHAVSATAFDPSAWLA